MRSETHYPNCRVCGEEALEGGWHTGGRFLCHLCHKDIEGYDDNNGYDVLCNNHNRSDEDWAIYWGNGED